MSRKFWVIITTFATLGALTVGCGSDDSAAGSGAFTSAQSAIKHNDFAKASAYFDVASKYGNKKKNSKKYAQQSTYLQLATNKFNDNQLKSALKDAKHVGKSTSDIHRAKDKLVNKITVRQQNMIAFNHELSLANDAAKLGNSSSAINTLNDLLNDKDVKSKAYDQIKIKALTLKNVILSSTNKRTSNDNSTDTNAHSNNNSTTAKSSNSSSANYSHHDNDSATSQVSVTEINKARHDLQTEGVDTSSWSNSDIAKAVINAKKAGHSKVTESDMDNYQK